jgi:hypothetical protein
MATALKKAYATTKPNVRIPWLKYQPKNLSIIVEIASLIVRNTISVIIAVKLYKAINHEERAIKNMGSSTFCSNDITK